MTTHQGHGHDATPAARAICRKQTAAFGTQADAFLAKLAGSFGWGYKDDAERAQLIRRTALRVGAITEDQASGYIGWDAVTGAPVRNDDQVVSARDAMIAIYRQNPGFTWNQFCNMHS